MSRADLAARQSALVAALVGGSAVPSGFDETRLRATTEALLRKRSGEVGAAWPALRAFLGPQWTPLFMTFAAGRPPAGSLRDGWDFARYVATQRPLSAGAAVELARRAVAWRYDGSTAPRARRGPAVRFAGGCFVVHIGGFTRVWSWRLG